MKVFIYSSGADTGGTGYRIKQAITRHVPDVSVTAMCTTLGYMRYPYDLRYNKAIALRLFEHADVVHLQNTISAIRYQARPSSVVLHHHGSRFRTNPDLIFEQGASIGAKQICSTIDLELLHDDVQWQPGPFDIDAIRTLRQPRQRSTLRIIHAPTSRVVKSTELVIATVNRLRGKGFDVELELIERLPNATCLARKAQGDILVDQLKLGYGNNAIEAWALGLPVLGGVADQTIRSHMIARWGRLPFFEADEQTFEEKLVALIEDEELRQLWAMTGEAHIRHFHDQSVVAHQLVDLYRSVIAA